MSGLVNVRHALLTAAHAIRRQVSVDQILEMGAMRRSIVVV